MTFTLSSLRSWTCFPRIKSLSLSLFSIFTSAFLLFLFCFLHVFICSKNSSTLSGSRSSQDANLSGSFRSSLSLQGRPPSTVLGNSDSRYVDHSWLNQYQDEEPDYIFLPVAGLLFFLLFHYSLSCLCLKLCPFHISFCFFYFINK